MLSPRIAKLLEDPAPEAVDCLWREAADSGIPLVESVGDGRSLVTFLWRGEATSTAVYWSVNLPLTRVPGTDLWYRSEEYPDDLRVQYMLVHDGEVGLPTDDSGTGPVHIDTANPRRVYFPPDPRNPGEDPAWASLLELPEAPTEPWSEARSGVPTGSLEEATFSSAALGYDVPVTIYRPAVATQRLSALVAFDGFTDIHTLRMPTTLDNLIDSGRVPQIGAIFVHSIDGKRDEMLSPGRATSAFVCDELLPWAEKSYGVGTKSKNLITGQSRGGLISAYLGLSRPDVFDRVVAQSGSYWWPSGDEGEPAWLVREVRKMPRSRVRFYLDCGVLETLPGPHGAPDILSVNRAMRDALRARGHELTYAEFNGGHDLVNWRRTFADGLLAVCARRLPGTRVAI